VRLGSAAPKDALRRYKAVIDDGFALASRVAADHTRSARPETIAEA